MHDLVGLGRYSQQKARILDRKSASRSCMIELSTAGSFGGSITIGAGHSSRLGARETLAHPESISAQSVDSAIALGSRIA